MRRPTCVELFAGGGGAARGLHQAGFRALAHSEWDPAACSTLRAAVTAGMIEGDVLEGDVREVDWTPYVGVDLVWASPPCQAWSSAGKRLGAQDERNGWPWTWAAVDQIRPTWLICENVGGLLHHLSAGHPERTETTRGLFGDVVRNLGPDPTPNPGGCARCYWDGVIVPEARRRFAHVDWRLLDCADYGMIAACPLHSLNIPGSAAAAAESCDRTTGLAYVGLPATRSSDEAATRLALDVVEHWARAIRSACAADAPAHERLNSLLLLAQRAQTIRSGRADGTWMSVGMSESGWMESTVESIASWLSDFSADPSLQQRWSTTSTETRRTTLQRIWRCIAATVTTGACTGTAERSAGCGLCLDWSVPQHRERLILVCGPEPYRWPVPTHRDPRLVHAVGKPWVTVREALGIGVEGVIEHDSGAGFSDRHGLRTPTTVNEPSPSITAGSKGSGPRLILRERHPDATPDSPAGTVRSGGNGHSAPPMWLRTECTGHAEDPGVRRARDTLAGSEPWRLDMPSPCVTAVGEMKGSGDGGSPHKLQRASDALYLGAGRRRLTTDECAALQSFPPDWPWSGNKTEVYRQIGNAVPPPLATAVARPH